MHLCYSSHKSSGVVIVCENWKPWESCGKNTTVAALWSFAWMFKSNEKKWRRLLAAATHKKQILGKRAFPVVRLLAWWWWPRRKLWHFGICFTFRWILLPKGNKTRNPSSLKARDWIFLNRLNLFQSIESFESIESI